MKKQKYYKNKQQHVSNIPKKLASFCSSSCSGSSEIQKQLAETCLDSSAKNPSS